MANKRPTPVLAQLTVRQLRARRRRLARELPDLEELLRGSVLSQQRRCGKAGCRCARGELHGPYVYLSLGRQAPGARLLYVPEAMAEVVRRRVGAGGDLGHQRGAAGPPGAGLARGLGGDGGAHGPLLVSARKFTVARRPNGLQSRAKRTKRSTRQAGRDFKATPPPVQPGGEDSNACSGALGTVEPAGPNRDSSRNGQLLG